MSDDELENSPPRRSREQLQGWVDEFEEMEHCIAGSISVAPQEDDSVEDTGLVILRLRYASSFVYMKPRGFDDPLWEMTITPQPRELGLSVHGIASLAAELVVASNLCTFLQWKSLEWDRESGQRELASGEGR
ncbi:hypothetical protein [Microbacterium testaceum]|uniref:hypothetical protein n=1 Tax=Microbacterium testaceum TaxID=2033 RepID=UPI0012466480|nr:hypothetical protein [Microbacterium testaceum]